MAMPGHENGAAAVEQVRVRVLPDGRMSRADAARYSQEHTLGARTDQNSCRIAGMEGKP